jgi:plastocyanin
MKYALMTTGLVAMTVAGASCGGYTNSPTTPTPTAAPPVGATIIDVIRENGAQSFSPNPATIPAGQMVAWHNVDTTTHRVVLDDGAVDTGNIAPGAFSAPMILRTVGPYHCSIHPSMVGRMITGQ